MFRLRKPIALFLCLAALCIVLPAELWHELSGHEDTDDHGYCSSHDEQGEVIGEKHFHCAVLQLNLPPFHLQQNFAPDFSLPVVFRRSLFVITDPFSEQFNLFFLRGPPSLC